MAASLTDQVLADAGLANIDAEFEQFALNARRAPEGIVATHLVNQSPRFLGDRRSARLPVADPPCPKEPGSGRTGAPFFAPGSQKHLGGTGGTLLDKDC